MNGKERSKKSQKGQSQGFDEPPTQSSRQETGAEAEYEEAGLQSFATPEEGAEEEAAYHAAPHTQSGVDEGLLEIKSEIERQLIASAASGVVQAEDALEGSGLITGVGIGQGLPDQLFPNDALISDVTPGTPVLNVYVTEAVPVETVRGDHRGKHGCIGREQR